MATVYANSNDGAVYSSNQSSWSDAHSISSGTADSNDTYSGINTVAGVYRNVGGRGSAYRVHRLFFYFDTSGISGTVSAATLKLYGVNPSGVETTKNVIAVKSTAHGGDGGTALHNDDINNIDVSTPYSSQTSSWTTSGYNDITLNATARGHMASQDYLLVAIINYEYDYSNTDPGVNASYSNGVYFTDYSSTSRDPYIDYTVVTGYGNKVINVASANIGKVKGVATASIDKVIGV
tara:strand:+ start:2729 stop:3436 length:708 start_codon:yes stop_codon:yes gene_type:complete